MKLCNVFAMPLDFTLHRCYSTGLLLNIHPFSCIHFIIHPFIHHVCCLYGFCLSTGRGTPFIGIYFLNWNLWITERWTSALLYYACWRGKPLCFLANLGHLILRLVNSSYKCILSTLFMYNQYKKTLEELRNWLMLQL